MSLTSLNKLEKKIISIASSTSAQTLPAGTALVLDFPTITEDNYGSITVKGSADWKFTTPKSGIYDIQAQIATAAHTLVSAKYYELMVNVNGTKVGTLDRFQSQSTTASTIVYLKGETSIRLTKGDVVTFSAITNSAVPVALSTTTLLNKVVVIKRETKIEEN